MEKCIIRFGLLGINTVRDETINEWLDKGTLGKNRTILISMGWKF